MYCVAGEAAANVAGIPIERLVRDKIFKPLGFSSMGFTMNAMSKNPNHALPYKAVSYEDAVAGRFIELPLDGMAEKSAAAGDMYASVLDLARWGQVVMKEGLYNGKQVLSKEGIAATLTAHTIMNPALRDPDVGLSLQYGMGWALSSYKGNNLYEHSKTTLMNHMIRIAFEIGSRNSAVNVNTVRISLFHAIAKKKNRWSRLWLND
jgi:CubicO group peptidase (beta-lactamase class C family)